MVRRTGRAERTEDPMPHTLSDVLVVLEDATATRGLDELEDDDARAAREGARASPCCSRRRSGMRIDEGLGGTPADLSVRIFGPDLDELARLAEQAERDHGEASTGSTDLRAEQLTGLPQLRIAVEPRRPRRASG